MASTIIRAFELAKSGECRSIYEIEKRLSKEGYVDAAGHLNGMTIRNQLNQMLYGLKVSGPVTAANEGAG